MTLEFHSMMSCAAVAWTAFALTSCGEQGQPAAGQQSLKRDEHSLRAALKEVLKQRGPDVMEQVEALCRGEPQRPLTDSVTEDFPWSPRTIEHGLNLASAYSNSQMGPEVVGGDETTGYPACVAVGCDGSWGCSGTLIASNAVVTAAHCCDQLTACGGKIFVKPCSDVGALARTYEAFPPVYPPEQQGLSCTQRERRSQPHDIAVLILKSDITTITPMPLSCAEPINSAKDLVVVGFGLNDEGKPGKKAEAIVPVESSSCGRPNDPEKYGCYADEIVAKDTPDRIRRRDTCDGDSGGPAIVNGALAAVTSRAVRNSRRCGDGGVYVRIDAHLGWLRTIPGIRWPAPRDDCQGQVPSPP